MLRALYKAVLALPQFRGRHRLDNALRAALRPPVDEVAGLKMALDPLEWNQISLLSGDLPERGTLDLFSRLLQPGDTYIDIGAHVGLHALTAARAVGPSGQVFAVDPQPYNCDRLLTNADLNGFANILVLAAAAGDEDGTVVLHNQKANDKTRLTLAGDGVSDVATRFETPLMRLDTLAKRHGVKAVKLLKIDVEGYELPVLAGAAKTLGVTANLVYECLPDTDPALSRAIADLLTGHGFQLRQIDGSPWAPGQPAIEHNIWAARA